MAEKIIQLDRNGSAPEVEIIIGQAQFGKYVFNLFDPTGSASRQVSTGINTDNIPDKFTLLAAGSQITALDKTLLTWEVAVKAYQSGPGQLYSVITNISQDGVLIPGGQIEDSGALDGATFVFNFVRLIVL